jgi:Membrane carboxypeptidase (penicillin-binding protein)
MKQFARFVALLALWLVRREWFELRDRLAQAYRSHEDDFIGCPSVLAQQLLISGEDHRFFSHGGIDLIAVCRAAWRGIAFRCREGASTIEMQVVRVVSGRYERTFRRKVREMALATLVTQVIPKEALPAIYLRLGYFGWRMNGFAAACRRIGRRPESLTPIETARLVARLKYPQPRDASPHRWEQIDVRARHLLQLHMHHRQDHTYFGLMTKTSYATV